MNGASAELDAILKGLLLNIEAGEGWEKGGVDVHDAIRIALNEQVRDDPHEAREDDKRHVVRLKGLYDASVVIFSFFSLFLLKENMGNVVFFGPLDGKGIFFVAN